MATGTNKNRSAYFSPMEIDMLLKAYSDYEPIFRKKSNKAAAAKERRIAWDKIAARVNEGNPLGMKRTWQQLKMKYKNLVQAANRKKAEAAKNGPAPVSQTDAEEIDFNLNAGKPVIVGTSGNSTELDTPQESSAFIIYPDANYCLWEPRVKAEPQAIGYEVNETVSAPATSTENVNEQQESPPFSAVPMNTLPVKDLYKLHLIKKIEKSDKEMSHLDRQIEKADLEIAILKQKLEDMKKPN